MSNNSNFIHTKDEHCLGCNKCIFVCPTDANYALWEDDKNKVHIKEGFCISCGECLSICDHSARDYEDDTEVFFEDLKKGIPISLIVAPASITNFNNLNKVFSYLRSKGVDRIFDVSYGADICVWAYIKGITEHNIKTAIAQPCPVIVSYIEKFKPNLIPKLMPIQSPAVCTSIFLEKYKNIKTKIAFLSPCIGKKRESVDANTAEHIHYNVTFSKLLEYINKKNVHIDSFPSTGYDQLSGAWGSLFARPGGLSENIRGYLGESVWIKQIEGTSSVLNYLEQYEEDLNNQKPVPVLLDVLNCADGCNLGTGTAHVAKYNQIDFLSNKNKHKISIEEANNLKSYFDKTLSYDDFIRHYTDKSDQYISKEITASSLEDAFLSLGKYTTEERNVNCFACGYGSCNAFATAIAKGENHRNNCMKYLLNKYVSLSLTDDLTGLKNRLAFSNAIENFEENNYTSVGIIFIDINHLKITNDQYGHDEGDQLIISCSTIIDSIFRENAFRIGGDEFVILIPNVSKDEFTQKIFLLESQVDKNETLKVSIGYHWSDDTNNLSSYIAKADENMYENKIQYYKELEQNNGS